jgi:hypothetical protein
VFPLVGGRKVEHLKENIKALEISLSPDQIQRIEGAKPIEFGFPYTLIVRIPIQLPRTSPELVNRDIAQKRQLLGAPLRCTFMIVSPRRG